MSFRLLIAVAGTLGLAGAAHAVDAIPSRDRLAQAAAKRFPTPVPVGDLLNKQVLEPLESQPTLGWIRQVVQHPDGTIDVVIDYGARFRYLTRPIAVPIEAMVLVGQYPEITGIKAQQLESWPTFDGTGATPLSPDAKVRIGLEKPSD